MRANHILDYYKQEKNITPPDYPRNDNWWHQRGGDLYLDNFESAGFKQINERDIKIGDVFLAQVKSDMPNHGGIMYANGLILHHLREQLSVIEPVYRWLKYVRCWSRYKR